MFQLLHRISGFGVGHDINPSLDLKYELMLKFSLEF